jgi:glycosyltransferase involved in cell wall biosynthesis
MLPDVRPVLEAADVFVLPSRREGLSVALMEAMSAGLACIVTDLPGNRALIEHGETGLVVPVGDVTALGAPCGVLPRARRARTPRLTRAPPDRVRLLR